MSKSNDSIQKTVVVAFLLCIVCSILVAGSTVLLKPVQVANRLLNMKENILRSAGMVGERPSRQEVEAAFSSVEQRIVNLETGQFVEPSDAGYASIDAFDQKKVSRNPATSEALSSEQDLAGIKRRERYAKVYLVKDGDSLSKIILPVRGYGLWSTLYGFMALKGDADTVLGFGFYEHAETPGLGGEVDNPNWKALWPGKEVYDDEGEVAVSLVKGNVQESSPTAKYSVDSLAGATLTSRGVENLIHYWMGLQGYKLFLNKLKSGEAGNV